MLARNAERMNTASSPTRSTVLVVEDDQDLRPVLAESLEDAGFAVAESPDAADARARLEGFAYDALVVDLTLPDGNGMAVSTAARVAAGDCPTAGTSRVVSSA